MKARLALPIFGSLAGSKSREASLVCLREWQPIMAGKGGWWKVYDDILDDPKVERLDHLSFRVFIAAMAFCNRSPYRQRERGWLLHSKGFAVDATDFARKLGVTTEEAERSLEVLCTTGAESSLLVCDVLDGVRCYRVRAWRKRQDGKPEATQEEAEQIPGECPESTPYPENTQEVPHIDVKTLDVDGDVDGDVDSGQRPVARKRTTRAPSTTPLAWYIDAHKEAHPGCEYVMAASRCGKACRDREAEYGQEKMRALFGTYLSLPRFSKQNWSPWTFFQDWCLTELLAMNGGSQEEYDGRFDYPDEEPPQ